MVSPRLVIDSPTTFIPAPYGLLSVISLQESSNVHWQNGITYLTKCVATGGTTFDECLTNVTGAPSEPNPKEANAELEYRGATPFTVYAEFDCSMVGVTNASKIAEDALTQTASWQLERAFWTGQADGQPVVYPHLASTVEVIDDGGILMQSAAVTGDAGGDIACGLGFLEEQLGTCYNGVGVIHVPRKVLPALAAWNLVESRGAQLYTKNGNLVAVGSGYPGTGPAGQAVTQCSSWMFATGAVFGYSGPVRVFNQTDSFDRSENTAHMIAERTYVIGWDCCHAAVSVDLETTGP